MAVEMCRDFVLHPRIVEETKKTIGERLRLTRKALGLTQAKLCKRIECSTTRWGNYETGEREIPHRIAARLRKEFGVSLDWIYCGDSGALAYELAIKLRRAA